MAKWVSSFCLGREMEGAARGVEPAEASEGTPSQLAPSQPPEGAGSSEIFTSRRSRKEP